MKKILSLLLTVAMLFGAMLALASCGAPENAGAEIKVYLGPDVYDFDPTDYYADRNAEQVMSLLYEPLFKINEKGDLVCAAAKDYEIVKSERKIKIDLRESYWSDEIRVTASDFTYAWGMLVLDHNRPNPAAALFYDVENAVAIKAGELGYSEFGAVASDTYEITITYREGANYEQLLRNLASVATAPVRVDIVEKAPLHWSKDSANIVTNGPFKIEALNRETGEFTLGRNMGFHQKSSVKDYTKNVTPAALISFIAKNGVVDLTYQDIVNKTVFYMGDASLEERVANADKANVADALSAYTYVFNTDNPLFAIKEVRKALSLVLDREMIAETLGFGKAATGFLTDSAAKSIYGKTVEERIATTAAVDEAKALIAKADLTGVAKSFTLTVNNDEESVAAAELAKAAWKELGFNVTIKKVDTIATQVLDKGEKITILDSAIQALVKEASYGNRNFDVLALDWQMYSDDALVALSAFTSHMNGNGTDTASTSVYRSNVSGWSSYEYDQYINRAFSAKTAEERSEALIAAEKLLLEESPVIPVIYNQNFAFVSSDLSGITADGFGNFVLTKTKQKNYEKYLPEND